jgi:hypothetical protein
MRFVYCISSHGFGHAARACAVIAAVRRRLPESRFTLWTSTPSWFFKDSLSEEPEIDDVGSDLGLVQVDPFQEDLLASVEKLRQRIPFAAAEVTDLARRLRALRPEMVFCDISPLGLAAAREAGIPSLLIENFTWDFIYRAYSNDHPELGPIADALEEVLSSASYRIQTAPVCQLAADALQVPSVSREPRSGRDEVRRRLGIPRDAPMVLVTMGGFAWSHDRLVAELSGDDDPWVVVPGAGSERRQGRLLLLPHRTPLYHPDLIQAADAVVAKLGYSTVAEVYRAGLPMAYLTRARFPESPHLEAWVQQQLPASVRLENQELQDGSWLGKVRGLLDSPPRPPGTPNGAIAIADLVAEWIGAT